MVDDDADIRELVSRCWRRAGYTTDEAADGREGLRCSTGGGRLVVLDVSMPGLDGWTTLERIRELSDVPC